jgi:hypothetical protein
MDRNEEATIAAFNALLEREQLALIGLSLADVDFLRFLINGQLEAFDADTPGCLLEASDEVVGMMVGLSARLLDLFSPLAWIEYQELVGAEIIEPPVGGFGDF